MKKISWSRVLPLFAAGLLVTGVLAFASSSSGSAHGRSSNNSTKYVLSLTQAQQEEEATPTAQDTEENGDGATTSKIELNSYTFLENESQEEPSTAAAETGDNSLQFQADSGKASPMLFNLANTSEVIPEATLVVKKDKHSSDFLTFSMTNLTIASYQNMAAQNGEDDDPQDVVVMSFETLEISNTADGDNAMHEGWNFKENKEM